MTEKCRRPNGELQGDAKSMPDCGTGTGMTPNQQTDGFSLDVDATNRAGRVSGGSDPALTNRPIKP